MGAVVPSHRQSCQWHRARGIRAVWPGLVPGLGPIQPIWSDDARHYSPAGTSLFTPVLTFFNNNAALPENTTFTKAELLAQANSTWDALAVRTECIIDGVPVKGLEDPQETAYRVQTGLFVVAVADHDNLLAGDGVPDGGTIDEVAVGAFLTIKPLSVGEHTVRLVGSIEPAPGFVLTKDITYTITVTP